MKKYTMKFSISNHMTDSKQIIGRCLPFCEYSLFKNQLSEPFVASFDFWVAISNGVKEEHQRICFFQAYIDMKLCTIFEICAFIVYIKIL